MKILDTRDWAAELAANERRLVNRLALEQDLQRALDLGLERMAEAIRLEIESLEE